VRDENGRLQGATANEESIAGRIYRRIGRDEDLQVNVTGDRLFQPVGSAGTDADIFYVIAALRDTIGNNNVPPEGFEETRSNTHLREQLDAIRERITEQQTYLGAAGERLQQTLSRLKEREIQLTDSLEQAQGVDMTDLVSRASLEETVYNALAGMGSQLIRQSLVDYLQ
jgi:flagellin-like hook-associated protein FlgL